MRYKKLSSRIFGLAITAALALLAFSASAAQAENLTDGGKEALFRTLESGPLIVGETFTGKLEKWTDGLVHGFLLVEKLNLTILCSAFIVEEGLIFNDKEALVKIKFTGCKSFNFEGKEELKTCVITSKAEGGEKEVITATAIALAKKHEGESYLLFHPDGKEFFTSIFFEKEKGCALTLKNDIKGLFNALLKEPEAVINLATSNEGIQFLMLGGPKILYGANPAVLDFNATLELTGAHKGCKFGVV